MVRKLYLFASKSFFNFNKNNKLENPKIKAGVIWNVKIFYNWKIIIMNLNKILKKVFLSPKSKFPKPITDFCCVK